MGPRTKSQFIPNQARKSVPILGSRGTTAGICSAFTRPSDFRPDDDTRLVDQRKSELGCLQSRSGKRQPRARFTLIIKRSVNPTWETFASRQKTADGADFARPLPETFTNCLRIEGKRGGAACARAINLGSLGVHIKLIKSVVEIMAERAPCPVAAAAHRFQMAGRKWLEENGTHPHG